MILPFILALLVICLTVIVRKKFSYWKNLGIPFITPTFPFGNVAAVIRKEKSFGVAIYDLYKKSEEPIEGFFLLLRPSLLVRDKNLIRNILTNDFEHFHDRGVYCNPKSDPMSANLSALPGEQWKPLRNKITPAFTSGKLKGMFPHIKHVAQDLVKYLEPKAEREEKIEIFDFTHRFVVDCLASVAFGQDGISTINNPHDDFITIPEISNNNSFSSAIRNAGLFVFPG